MTQMMKVVDLENVVQKGTNALTLEQKGMLNGMMGRTMQDVFKSAYQNDVLFRYCPCSHFTAILLMLFGISSVAVFLQ